jgi:DNA invertase Pin-like site-specific DNA recombinase
MSESVAPSRTCRFPGCERPAAPAEEGVGRPPEYCEDPHTQSGGPPRHGGGDHAGRVVPDDLDRPVSMARARAGEYAERVAAQVETLTATLGAVVAELRTLGDPDAAAVQLDAHRATRPGRRRAGAGERRPGRAHRDDRRAGRRPAKSEKSGQFARPAGTAWRMLGTAEPKVPRPCGSKDVGLPGFCRKRSFATHDLAGHRRRQIARSASVKTSGRKLRVTDFGPYRLRDTVRAMGRYGYARVSTHTQKEDSQLDALHAAGCERIWTDQASGKLARRPEWDDLLDYLRSGDELVITRLSRMARSVRHLTEIAALLHEKSVDLVVIKQGIDTTTPSGRFLFHVIGAMDEMLADLISEGTLEGLEAARSRGRTGGRKPKLTARQDVIARQMYDEKDTYGKRVYTVADIAETFHVSRKTIYRHLG